MFKRTVHPGVILRDELAEFGVAATSFARQIDVPPNRISQIGDARFYTYVGEDLTFENWLSAVKAGHTFATTGPIVDLKVNDSLPGSQVDIGKGDTVRIVASAFGDGSRIGLTDLEIVGHGEVLKRVSGQGEKQLSLEFELEVERGIWIAARVSAGPGYLAHTTPVYVTVEGGSFHNPETLEANLERCERDLGELEQEILEPGSQLDSEAWRHAESLRNQIAETREALGALAARLME